jgi:hypothetical protein
VNDDNQENRPRMRYFRYAVFSLTALLVLSLGFALIPPERPAPAEPPFSEKARAAALEETLRLRAAGQELAASGPGSVAGVPLDDAADKVVTLLTLQARALLLPASPAAGGPAASRTPASPASATGSPSTPPSSGVSVSVTAAEFAAALAASGQQRLKDAKTADGGMARLLAGAGTAQLLAAERLGAPRVTPPEEPVQDGQETAATCPAAPPTAGVSAGAALVAAREAELETVYGYQAALTRLPPEGAGPASEFLAQHQDLADEAEKYSLMHCGTPSPRSPGYVLSQEFLDAPAAGLARLETATLPPYGDIVALAGGEARAWALSALQAAARRAQHWEARPNPLPGLVLDESKLPELPE